MGLSSVLLRPVRGHHAFESCVEQLATAIRLGVYGDGSALPPERELAERMAVSRATLREAIAALRSAGMVRTTRGRGGGTVVSFDPAAAAQTAPPDFDRRREALLDSLVFRRIVEPGACHTAASRELDDVAEKLLTDTLQEVSEAEGRGVHRQADSRFHLAIATITGSEKTISAVATLQADLHDLLNAIPVLQVNIEHSNAQHHAIATAILAGDPARARRVMEQHCDDTAALLRGLLGNTAEGQE